jgi:hypothetical protein
MPIAQPRQNQGVHWSRDPVSQNGKRHRRGPVTPVVTIQTQPPRRQTDARPRGRNRTSSRGSNDLRHGGGIGLVAGEASSLMATRRRNVRWRRRRALGWTAKTGPIAGPTESPMATRTKRLTQGPTSGVMAFVLALGGAIVYHDGDARTTARRATVGDMARRAVSWGQRKIVTKRCTRGGLACGIGW